ncbi:hypothetical protein MFM001_42840 [Mycobacterium sp. MFM001]|uniref:hypothetical protein n=1 Tax=Mycobacterium sp. MFM001 TaxID=2049453 RepID=UPI000DA4E5E9|nr:hypothetical protein [Mycobacterium sp. MFM001]GBE67822.1 hypothetical protein MFM001_42840 [Mycobacterium sp. MFM001]
MTTEVDQKLSVRESVAVEVVRKKSRQGSETRRKVTRLQVRYDPEKLAALESAAKDAGAHVPELIRQTGDLLTELLPVAAKQGIAVPELLRQTASVLLAEPA